MAMLKTPKCPSIAYVAEQHEGAELQLYPVCFDRANTFALLLELAEKQAVWLITGRGPEQIKIAHDGKVEWVYSKRLHLPCLLDALPESLWSDEDFQPTLVYLRAYEEGLCARMANLAAMGPANRGGFPASDIKEIGKSGVSYLRFRANAERYAKKQQKLANRNDDLISEQAYLIMSLVLLLPYLF